MNQSPVLEEANNTIRLAELAQRLGRADADAWFEKANAAFEHAVGHQGMEMGDSCAICDSRWQVRQDIADAARREWERVRFERMVTQ